MIFIKNLFRICNLIYIPIALLAFSLSILVRLFLDRKPKDKEPPRPTERVDCPIHGKQVTINFECKDSVVGEWKVGPLCLKCFAEVSKLWIEAMQRKDNQKSTD